EEARFGMEAVTEGAEERLFDVGGGKVGEPAGTDFSQIGASLDDQATTSDDQVGRLDAARQVAAENAVDGNAGELAGDRFGLLPACRVERHRVGAVGSALLVEVAHVAMPQQVNAPPRQSGKRGKG